MVGMGRIRMTEDVEGTEGVEGMEGMARGHGASGGVGLPREIVLASAGTGKTFRLSSRIIALLNAGAPPHEILASTFTRKAAGEILERVLVRLARAVVDEGKREELARHAGLAGAPALDRARVEVLLLELVDSLHRVNVSTLDAFFHRVARAFALEMGLVPGWGVADPADGEALVAAAVDRLLREVDREEMVELLRLHRSGDVARGVHGELLSVVEGIQRVAREVDPRVPHPWGFQGDGGRAAPPAASEIEALVRRLGEVELPRTKSGSPDARWAGAVQAHAEDLRSRQWDRVVTRGILGAVLAGKEAYYRHEVSREWEALAREAAGLARRALQPELEGRARALQALAEGFEAAFTAEQERRGLYRFEDIPHLLLGSGATGREGELYFRLDGRIRHLLLDEFQDTSVLQWRALEPLAEELLQGGEGDRALVVVADPKQSIYGWRGGEPRLLHRIAQRSGIGFQDLLLSYRSSSVVLDAVNRIAGAFTRSSVLDRDHERQAAAEWGEGFPRHEAFHTDRPGFLRVIQVPEEEGRSELRPGVLAAAADEAARLHQEAPEASVGVLCRTGRAVNRMIWELRRREIPVSEEGGGPVLDAWPVHPVLALLRVADHPGDRLARYVVATSPLGRVEGLQDWGSDGVADRVGSRIRRRLLLEGYGPVLEEWVRPLLPGSAPRERVRLGQLVELGFRQDVAGIPPRPSAFLRRVASTRMEAPGGARVRVMTIHASKGLEFDAVVLPELESGFRKGGGGRPGPIPVRPDPAGPVTRVFPPVPRDLLPLFPEVEAAVLAQEASRFHDELGGLYVALTRARHALHLVVEAGREGKATPAELVREGLGLHPRDPVRVEEGVEVLLEEGDPDWHRHLGGREGEGDPGDGASPSPLPLPESIPLAPVRARRRFLPRVTPSELEGGGARTVSELLRTAGGEARRRGSVVHAWLEAVEWLEVGVPEDGELAERARALGMEDEEVAHLLPRFRAWLREAPLREVLSRERWPVGTRAVRELSFLHREGNRILSGTVDRLLLLPREGGGLGGGAAEGTAGGTAGEVPRVAGIRVVDFKTDRFPPDPAEAARALDARTEHYRPQLEAYRRAMAARYGVPTSRVETMLVYLEAGVLRRG
jgi:ATP-dependent helicase/nuclease subunit A